MADTLVNIEAEAEFLGGLMLNGDMVERFADTVSPDDFHEPAHSRIFAAIVRQAALGKPSHPVALKGYFEGDEGLAALGGVGYLARLTGSTSGLAVNDLGKMIADLGGRRRMRAGLAVASEACADLDIPPSEIIGHADAALSGNAADSIHQPTGGQCFDELMASFQDRTKGVTCRVIKPLDDLLGPMRPKQLVIGAGRPGMGKTAMALSYALGAAQAGHGVLFVSLEMSSTELAARMAADMCFNEGEGVPYNFIRDGDLNAWQARKVAEAGSRMHGLPFQVVDAGSLSIGRLNMLVRRHARRMAAQGHKLELVVVDYLQLLSPDSKGRSTYEAVSEVSRGLKAMAKDHGVAVFALAQLSRSVETRPDKRPQLSDLRDSGQIEQDADAVLFLLRTEYYLRQAEPGPGDAGRMDWEKNLSDCQGQIEFIVAKRRNGVTGSSFGMFHGAYQAVRGPVQHGY